MRQNAKVCSAMQQVKNAMGWNAMKLLRMHQNALICTGMRMGKNYTTFGKKLHLSRVARGVAARTMAAALAWAAAWWWPGPLLGMVRSMENNTLAAERRRVITQAGSVQLSRALSASLRVAI
jgi:hypothetical protein